jgi:hypothetical protein
MLLFPLILGLSGLWGGILAENKYFCPDESKDIERKKNISI